MTKLRFCETGLNQANIMAAHGRCIGDFQSAHDLTVDGIAGQDTLEKIDEALSSRYREGDSGDHIVALKEDLTALGFANWSDPTPYYGPITAGVVEDFQSAYGLEVTGGADKITLETIENNVVKIFIDPGHGDHDTGGRGFGLNEKDVVLDIALETVEVLESEYKGANVNISRTTDTFVELEERAQMANDWDADYFVSIHNNAYNGSAHGFESYIYDGNVSANTIEKQEQIHHYIADELNKRNNIDNRGMKSRNFNVLRNTTMSAILLELLFIDNWAENTLLQDSGYRKELGKVTADAIANSFNLERR
ncbi:N-acetylmuramoyl-L-alanine amidase [Lentibacillus sp. CBA3610]|uniref:N-acetylmuramoyl-L-alanine amidase n=1 Tax=Lentibacillus sp. CBA3610 TaxID=2518176 RepID=UPI0015963B0F|nr:N-acetylmuramoyl-L-alanine amidase [Lentibacillus sp. CBA3610]